MRAFTRPCLLIAALLLSLLLLAAWIALPHRLSAHAAAGEFENSTHTPSFEGYPDGRAPQSLPDLRWLELVSVSEVSAAHLPQSGFSLNVNLTANLLAGVAPSLQTVSAWVERGGYTVAQGSADPVPDPLGNFYQTYLYWQDVPCLPQPDCDAHGLVPGDLVWVAQASESLSLTVPVLTALAEPQDDLLHGSAPPSSPLTAYLFPFAAPGALITRTALSDPAGGFQIDLSALPGLHRQDTGFLLVETAPARRAYLNDLLGMDTVRTPWLQPDGSFGIDTSDLPLRIGETGSLVVEDSHGSATARFFPILGYPVYLPWFSTP